MIGYRQFLALILVAGLALVGLAACGTSEDTAPAATPEPAPEVDETTITGDDFESGDTSQWESQPPAGQATEGDAQPDADEEGEEKEDPAT